MELRTWPPSFPDVSRETLDSLDAYVDQLLRWNSSINLVANSTTETLWQRHVIDSAQLFYIPRPTNGDWVDIGSGGGFPGIVIAILAKSMAQYMRVHLVESDARKAAFLATVSRSLDLNTLVHRKRIEHLQDLNAHTFSARAVAPIHGLLSLCTPHLSSETIALFPKGARAEDEIVMAQKHWSFTIERFPSITDPNATILKLGDIKRV